MSSFLSVFLIIRAPFFAFPLDIIRAILSVKSYGGESFFYCRLRDQFHRSLLQPKTSL